MEKIHMAYLMPARVARRRKDGSSVYGATIRTYVGTLTRQGACLRAAAWTPCNLQAKKQPPCMAPPFTAHCAIRNERLQPSAALRVDEHIRSSSECR